jgi:hypothetical protein
MFESNVLKDYPEQRSENRKNKSRWEFLQRGSIVQCAHVLPNYEDYINRLIHPEKS